ncbi:hypothetical protein [Daejeonella sp.]|jgi:hypothetical protein|uniref:hypothetical protein n=1 Tax=Daejeonella sp. TaxID=2805397 RepID=UPI0037830A61
MKKRYAIFLTILCLSTLAMGQVHKGFQWIGPDHSLFTINIKTGMLSQEEPKKPKIELGLIQNWDTIKTELPEDLGVNAFYQADSIIISIPGTGQVYSLRIPTLKLKRLDQTFFRGYNFNASQFFRNDTLFSIGGEGFWQKHSIITYYNPKTLEWAFYKFQKDNKHPSTNKFSGYSQKNDSFFSAFFEIDASVTKKNVLLRFYSFKKDEWEDKGILSDSQMQLSESYYRSIWTGEYLILIYDSSDSKILIADPFKNVLFEHQTTKDLFFMQNCELYYRDGKIFSRSILSQGKIGKIYFDSLNVDSLIKQSNIVGQVYGYDYFSNTNKLSAIGAFLVFSAGFLYYRKRRVKTEDYTLTELELLVVKKFINQPISEKISSIELNNLLQISTKSYDNQRQIRFRIIGAINHKLHVDLDSKNLIFRSSNNEDKRMMDYYINPDIKPKDLEKLTKSLF